MHRQDFWAEHSHGHIMCRFVGAHAEKQQQPDVLVHWPGGCCAVGSHIHQPGRHDRLFQGAACPDYCVKT